MSNPIPTNRGPKPVRESGPPPLDSCNSTQTPLSPGPFTDFAPDHPNDTLVAVAHGLSDGDRVVLKSDGTLPDGLEEDLAYVVSDANVDDFKLKNNDGQLGAYITFGDYGQGTHSFAVPGEFIGKWIRIDKHADMQVFAFSLAKFGSLDIEWSNNGSTLRPGVLGRTDVRASLDDALAPGFFIYLDNPTTNIDNYYRVVARSGSSDSSLSEIDTWVFPDGFSGTFGALRDPLSALSSALLTRSVIAGDVLDDDLADRAGFGNATLTGDGSFIVADPWRQVFRSNFEEDGVLPNGPTPAFDKVGPITDPNVLDSGWINVTRYKDQFAHTLFNVPGVRVFLMNASDDQGNNSQTTGFFPGTESAISQEVFPGVIGSSTVGAPFFDKYYRVVIINDSGQDCTSYTIRSMGSDTAPSPVYTGYNQPIFSFFPAPYVQAGIRALVEGTSDVVPVEATRLRNFKTSVEEIGPDVRHRAIAAKSTFFGQGVVTSQTPNLQIEWKKVEGAAIDLATKGATITDGALGSVALAGGDLLCSTGAGDGYAQFTTTLGVDYKAAEQFELWGTLELPNGPPPVGDVFYGLGHADFSDLFAIGYRDAVLGIFYASSDPRSDYEVGVPFPADARRGVNLRFIPQSEWDIDPADGSDLSRFKLNGSPIPLTFDQKRYLINIFSGFLGRAGPALGILDDDSTYEVLHEVKAGLKGRNLGAPDMKVVHFIENLSGDGLEYELRSGSSAILASGTSEAPGDTVSVTDTLDGLITSVNKVIHTVTPGRVAWLDDIELYITNILTSGGIAELRDGGPSGTVVRQYAITPGTNQTKTGLQLTLAYNSPPKFYQDITLVIPPTGIGAASSINLNLREFDL